MEKTSSVTHPSRLLTPASTGPGTTPTKDKPACCLLLLSTCFWRALWARVYYAVSALALRLLPASDGPELTSYMRSLSPNSASPGSSRDVQKKSPRTIICHPPPFAHPTSPISDSIISLHTTRSGSVERSGNIKRLQRHLS